MTCILYFYLDKNFAIALFNWGYKHFTKSFTLFTYRYTVLSKYFWFYLLLQVTVFENFTKKSFKGKLHS